MIKRRAGASSDPHCLEESPTRKGEPSHNTISSGNSSRTRHYRSPVPVVTAILVLLLLVWMVFFSSPLVSTKTTTPETAKRLHSKDNSKFRRGGEVWLAGIVRDASLIRPDVLAYLVDLNCRHQISIHVVANQGVTTCQQDRKRLQKLIHYGENAKSHHESHCAPFHVEREPHNINGDKEDSNRIDRIARVRDYQRSQLRSIIYDNDGGKSKKVKPLQNEKDDTIIIVADLDLYSLPNRTVLVQQLQNMASQTLHHNNNGGAAKDDFDAVCSAGVMYRPFGYYDTFATVLFPDTFVYPLRGRLNKTNYFKGENASLVRSNDLYGNYTQWDLLEYFEAESSRIMLSNKRAGRQNTRTNLDASTTLLSAPVPVRSCFGGLTIYRAATWFEEKCRYYLENITKNKDNLMRYATKTSKQPCEHVVFHSCLRKRNKNFKIAVQPSLRTEWNADLVFEDKLYPGNRHESLGVFKKYANHPRADRLTSGNYTLRINPNGVLVVEQQMGSDNKSRTIWSTPETGDKEDYWTHMFLMLKTDGTLELVKQVSKTTMDQRNHSAQVCKSTTTTRKPCVCDLRSDHCKVVVWTTALSSGGSGQVQKQTKKNDADEKAPSYVLILREDGQLVVVDERRNAVVWKNAR